MLGNVFPSYFSKCTGAYVQKRRQMLVRNPTGDIRLRRHDELVFVHWRPLGLAMISDLAAYIVLGGNDPAVDIEWYKLFIRVHQLLKGDPPAFAILQRLDIVHRRRLLQKALYRYADITLLHKPIGHLPPIN
jgi:hypothetical protein